MPTYESTVGALTDFAASKNGRKRDWKNFEFPLANGDSLSQHLRICGQTEGPGHNVAKLVAVQINNTSSSVPANSGTYTLQVRDHTNTQLLDADYNLETLPGSATENLNLTNTPADLLFEGGDYIKITCNATGDFTAGDTIYIALQFEDPTAP